ncbi:hypothetical protein HHA01_28060 [Halomonas halmophila]|uniref:Uncharacterized protein n=1 Tax=Halomonas halmophila TaxID=252 RepID=A0A4Y4F187_9GAMM|nr:hypothetical protein HHA01_28060 [Halomonas halmophila]
MDHGERDSASLGHRGFINYVNSADVAHQIAEEIHWQGGEARALQADGRDEAQLLGRLFDEPA